MGGDPCDPAVVVLVHLGGVENVVLADADEEVGGGDVLDAVGGCDHPLVGQEGRAALVAELAVLVLAEGDLGGGGDKEKNH